MDEGAVYTLVRSFFISTMSGWVSIHRKIMDKRSYFSESFCRNMAWVDMILLANHDKNYFRCRGVRVEVLRGQIGFGLEELAKRWMWSRGKVERYMKELEDEHQIVRQKSNVTTLITIVNYNQYQTFDKANGNTNNKANSKANGQQTVKQTDINNNVNNYNNENNVNNADGENCVFDLGFLLNPPKFPTWRKDVSEFLSDEYLIQQYIRNKKLPYATVVNFMREFVTNLNLQGDFKNYAGLKKHFNFHYEKHYGGKISKGTNNGALSNAFIEVPKDFDYSSLSENWDDYK